MYNTEEAVSYLLEEFPSDDDERDPDFVPNHYIVEENPTLSPPLPISVQNTNTSDDNAKDL